MPGSRTLVLVHERASLGLALVMVDILRRANSLLGRERFRVQVAARPGLREVRQGPVSVRVSAAPRRAEIVLVPPLSPGADPFAPFDAEVALLQRLAKQGAVVGSACLGSLLLAQAGLLEAREAATHWDWIGRARERFPEVRWNPGAMVCDEGDRITAGGYLAAVDLTLALVGRFCSRSVAHRLGRLLLADSVRQHQSVYATRLVDSRIEDPRMQRLESWLRGHLDQPIDARQMASVCRVSLRTFHREFRRAFGATPRKHVQLMRVERVKELLRRTDLSVEQAIAQVGVSDLPSFRKVFRRELGLSPAEYRRRIAAA